MSNARQAKSLRRGEPAVRVFAAGYPTGFSIGAHAHVYDQLVYASRGVMAIRAGGSRWVIPPERALWVPGGTEHEVVMVGSVAMRTVYFGPGVATGAPAECRVVSVSPLLRELILYAVGLGRMDWEQPMQRRLVELTLDLLNTLPVEPLELPMPRDERAVRVATLLLERPGRSTSLDELARRAAASRRTVERCFRTDTGMTLGRWRQRARLLRALQLIAQGEPVQRIAYQVGYESPSAFIAMFKRVMGTTPAAYYAARPVGPVAS